MRIAILISLFFASLYAKETSTLEKSPEQQIENSQSISTKESVTIPLSISEESITDDEIFLFTPPDNWKVQDPKNYTRFIKIAFAGEEKGFFRPTINLAVEENVGTEEEFLECVNIIQKKRKDSKWKKRCEIKTEAGIVHLFEDQQITTVGAIKILQGILVKNHTAYLLTASCLVKDMITFLPLYSKTFKSIKFTNDLFAMVEEDKRNPILKEIALADSKNFPSIEKKLEGASPKLGKYWQVLALKDAYEKVHTKK
jgi:hypothetical protein